MLSSRCYATARYWETALARDELVSVDLVVLSHRPAKKPFATSAKVVPYLHRCQWIKSYWEGKEQNLGGPRPLQGWKKPDTSMGLGVYSGKVRLVPV